MKKGMGGGGRRGPTPWFLRFVFAACIAAFAYIFYTQQERPKSATAPQPTPAAVSVRTVKVEPNPIDITKEGLGTVTPWQMATISPEVSGRIVEIPFREGGAIKKGEVLVRIDPRPFQAALDQAKAKRAQDVANLANTQKNLQRDQTLVAKGGYATQQTVDNEQSQVQVLKAAIEGDDAAIEAAQINLDFATVKAPFPSVVSLRNVDLGNLVTPATSIGTVTQIEPIAVYFTLPQGDLGEVRSAAAKGEPPVLAYDQSGKSLLSKGVLEVINNQIDQASGTIKLKARFENKDHKLWPGEFVQVAIVVRTELKALAAPSDAVQRGPSGPYVWLVSNDQTANRRPVQIGEIQNGVTVVESGLRPSDRIVVTGQYGLTQGAPIAEASPPRVAQSQEQ